MCKIKKEGRERKKRGFVIEISFKVFYNKIISDGVNYSIDTFSLGSICGILNDLMKYKDQSIKQSQNVQ